METAKNHKILVAVDGSRQSLQAVYYVSRIFPPEETHVVLYHVMSRMPEFFYDLGMEHQRDETMVNLEGWEKALEESMVKFMHEAREVLLSANIPPGEITTGIHERRKGVARDIIAESANGYTAVVLGRSGFGEGKGLVLGSVANKLLEKLARVSLCIVGGEPGAGKVLLALDTSDGAMQAAKFVRNMLGGSIQEVKMLHVVRGLGAHQREQVNLLKPDFEKEWLVIEENRITSVFEKAKNFFLKGGLDPRRLSTKVISGVSSRSAAIVREAQEGGYDTIVLGRRGLSKVQDFFMGRVGYKVIQQAEKHAVWVVS